MPAIGYPWIMTRALATAALVCLLACSSSRSDTSRVLPPDQAAEVLVDRNWIDVWPTSKSERLHVYRFTPAMGGGVFQDRTLFLGSFELFMFSIDRGHLVFEMPETEETVRTRYRIERVSGPEPFDLRLTLARTPRGPRVYYGRTAERAATWPMAELAHELRN